jgi:uncharacterized protein
VAATAASLLLPGLDWRIKVAIGLVVVIVGFGLLSGPKRGLRFALAILTIEVGALTAIRGVVAIDSASWWQYLMPFALVVVPAVYGAVILTRLGWWRLAGFTPPHQWRSPTSLVPLVLLLALPAAGLSAHRLMPTTAMILALQVGFLLINVVMEEVTYRGIVLAALTRYGPVRQILIAAVLFGLSHADNFFLPGSDPAGVWYQIFEAILIGVVFGAVRLRLNTIWPGLAVHAIYDFMLVLAFGHALPVAPTLPGFLVDTVVNLCLALIALTQARPAPSDAVRRLEAA